MPYTPPAGNALDLRLPAGVYTPPAGGALDLDLSAAGGATETGAPQLLLRMVVILPDQIFDSPALPLVVSVSASGAPELPLVLAVHYPSGAPELPLVVSVSASGAPELPLAMNVADGRYVTVWRPAVVVGNMDISARLVGQARVSVEEGGARVADLEFIPFAGAVAPSDWNGQAVTIDVVRIYGAVELSTRIFTGVVDLPEYDVPARRVRLSCSDDLQGRFKRMPRENAELIAKGKFHEALHGKSADMDAWDYVQACLATETAHLGADRQGRLWRVEWFPSGPWSEASGMGQFWRVEWADNPLLMRFTDADILSGSVRLDGLNRRAELINKVDVKIQWRYNRLRLGRARVRYHHPADLTQTYGVPPVTVNDLLDMDGLDGWDLTLDQVESINGYYYEVTQGVGLPTPYSIIINGVDQAEQKVESAHLRFTRRWAQTVTEVYDLVVSAPTSQDANGNAHGSVSAAWSSEWNAEAWESGGESDIDPALTSPTGIAVANYVPDAPDEPEDPEEPEVGAKEAIDQALKAGYKLILESHRQTRVPYQVPGLLEVDLDWACELDTGALATTGKVASLAHTLDFTSGACITDIALALCGIGNGPLNVLTDPLLPSEPPEIPAYTVPEEWDQEIVTNVGNTAADLYTPKQAGISAYMINMGKYMVLQDISSGVIKSLANPYYSEGNSHPFSGLEINLPGVDDALRQPIEVHVNKLFLVDLPVDTLTLN